MTRVFVTQETNHDFRSAEAFGDIVFITGKDFINVKHSQANERVIDQIEDKLRHFEPTVDWLVVAGSPFVSGAVFWMLGRMNKRNIQILRWDNRDQRYIPLHMEFRQDVLQTGHVVRSNI